MLLKKFKNVYVRTVTHDYIGEVAFVTDKFLTITRAIWIIDNCEFYAAISSGKFDVVEYYPQDYEVNLNMTTIVEIVEVPWDLPQETT